MPVPAPTVATAALPLLHAPPAEGFESVVTLPVHTDIVPVMAELDTVAIAVAVPQPVLYVIVVVPLLTPVTTPAADTVAVAVFALLQVPYKEAFDRVADEPEHTEAEPPIAAAGATTVIIVVARQPVLSE